MRRRTQHHQDTHRVKTLFAKLQKVLEWDHFNRNVIETIQVPAGRSFKEVLRPCNPWGPDPHYGHSAWDDTRACLLDAPNPAACTLNPDFLNLLQGVFDFVECSHGADFI